MGTDANLRVVQVLMQENTKKFAEWFEEAEKAEELPLHAVMMNSNGKEGHLDSTKHGGKRHHTSLAVKKKHVLIRTAKYAHQHLVMTPVCVPMSYSQKLVAISYGLAKRPVQTITGGNKSEVERMTTEVRTTRPHRYVFRLKAVPPSLCGLFRHRSVDPSESRLCFFNYFSIHSILVYFFYFFSYKSSSCSFFVNFRISSLKVSWL